MVSGTQVVSVESIEKQINELIQDLVDPSKRVAAMAAMTALEAQKAKLLKKPPKGGGPSPEENEAAFLKAFNDHILPYTYITERQGIAGAQFIYFQKSLSTKEVVSCYAEASSLNKAFSSLPEVLQNNVDQYLTPLRKPKAGQLTRAEGRQDCLAAILELMRGPEGRTHLLPKPVPVCSNSPDELCLHYIPLEIEEGPTPAWDEFLYRIGEPGNPLWKEYLAYVWTVFNTSLRGRQILWMRGAGGDGKSAAANTILVWLGGKDGVGTTFTCSAIKNSHGTELLAGKRFLLDPDSQHYGVVVDETMHKITGGDLMVVNPKGKPMYMADGYAKVMICSNYYPTITTTAANEKSRLLFLPVMSRPPENMSNGIAPGDTPWVERLAGERKQLLWKAKQAYEEMKFGEAGDIKIDNIPWAQVESGDKAALNKFFEDNNFVRGADLQTPRTEMEAAYWKSLDPKPKTEYRPSYLAKLKRMLGDIGITLVELKKPGSPQMYAGIGRVMAEDPERDAHKERDVVLLQVE
jgi:hypothetical protein